MSLIWHNFILFIQLFKRLLNLKVDMKYTYSIVLSDKKFILIKSVIGHHEYNDCNKCVFSRECLLIFLTEGEGLLCNKLANEVRYICDKRRLNNISLIISSYVKMHECYIIRVPYHIW